MCKQRGDRQLNHRDVRQTSFINDDQGEITGQHVRFRAEHNGTQPPGLDDGVFSQHLPLVVHLPHTMERVYVGVDVQPGVGPMLDRFRDSSDGLQPPLGQLAD